ncbi:MAG: HPF/RaiA family ribosome-associated protein [Rhodospirillaceae bacterium]|nr:HPF/RaiA family ribosome-associated protein [Rhodospirillaceae bacterium]
MQVPLQIAFHGVDTSAAVETRIREKVAKLEHYFDRITGCKVVVGRVHRAVSTKDQPFHVSVVLEVPGAELVAGRDPKDAKGHQDINAALADSFSAVERQLKSYVDRRKDKRAQAH